MKLNSKNNNQGFTIIEVLIVLVIAGLIMLIVFLAVPALQRNSRNNQRKSEAGRVLTAASEWRANNMPNWPASCVPAIFGPCSGAPNNTRNAILGNAGTLSIYGGNNMNVITDTTGNTGALASSALGTTLRTTGTGLVILFGQASCVDNTINTGSSFIVAYALETGNGSWQAVCN